MLNIAVCDDEKEIVENTRSCIKEYIHQRSINANIQGYTHPVRLLESIDTINIVFLDIKMNEYNGIVIAKHITKIAKSTIIIFITKHLEYLMNAFKVHAFDYILKPIEFDKISNCLDDLFYLNYRLLEYDINFQLKTKGYFINIKLDDIIYFEIYLRKIYCITKNGRIQIISNFKNINTIFSQYDFYSPHKSFLINFSKIESYKGYSIRMINDDVIPLSQKKSSNFRKKYKLYINDYIQNTKL